MSDPRLRIAELNEAARHFLDYCRVYVPIEDEPRPSGTPGPTWIISLQDAARRLVLSYQEIDIHQDYLREGIRSQRLSHGLSWFFNVLDQLIARWQWPPRAQISSWQGSCLDILFSGDEVEGPTPYKGPICRPLESTVNDDGTFTWTPEGVPDTPFPGIPTRIALDRNFLGLQVYDVTKPGGPWPKLLIILTHPDPDRRPDAFLLMRFIAPTIRRDELTAMDKAVTLIELGIQGPPDRPIGSYPADMPPPQTDLGLDDKVPSTEPDPAPAVEVGPELPTTHGPARRSRKEPSPVDYAAYLLYRNSDMNQAAVASEIAKKFRIPFDQSKVSRSVRKVKDWREAGNPLPNPKMITIDPSKLEQGPRHPKKDE